MPEYKLLNILDMNLFMDYIQEDNPTMFTLEFFVLSFFFFFFFAVMILTIDKKQSIAYFSADCSGFIEYTLNKVD